MISSIFGSLLILILLPTILELILVTLGAFFPRRKLTQSPALEGRWIIVIPAHNEETQIAHLLNNLKKCRGEFDTLVIADNCTDQTAQIVTKSGFRLLERHDSINKGKNKALSYAFTTLFQEKYDWFVILDADCFVEPNFIEVLQGYAQKGIPALQAYYGIDSAASQWRQKLMRIAFYSMNYLRPRGRSRLGFSSGILGLGFALHRSVLLEVPFENDAIAEDLWYHCQLVQAKIKVTFCEETAAYASAPTSGTGAKTQRARWEGGRLRTLMELFPQLLKGLFRGNILAFEPLLELATLPLAYYALLLIPLAFLMPITALACFTLLIIHVLTAIALKGSFYDLQTLLFVPFYALWKLTLLKDISKASKPDAAWVRTDRENKPTDKKP